MTIEETTNNNIKGYTIIDDKAEYFIPAETEEEALAKYNTEKEREANPPAPSESEIIKQFSDTIQDYLDEVAKARGYGDSKISPTLSIVTYIDDINPQFAKEAHIFKNWRSNVWTTCYQIIDDVRNEVRTQPTLEEVFSELPIINWDEE